MAQKGEILSNRQLKGDYFQVQFFDPETAKAAQPGQFVHVKIAGMDAHLLRRPFSINRADHATGTVQVTYKVVGAGTEVLSKLQPGAVCDLLGAEGHGFSMPEADEIPVMIAGGYGTAAMFMIAERAKNPGILLLGARGKADLILDDDYRVCGTDVRIATNDGSRGVKGFVTLLLDEILKENHPKYRFYACGPTPMLMAAGRMLVAAGAGKRAELSLDQIMCCGVGACFGCVVKVKDGDSWRYARSCYEGPVFPAEEVYYEC